MVQAEGVLQLAVVVFHPPAQLGQPNQIDQRPVLVKVGQPVLDGLVGSLGPLGQQPAQRQWPARRSVTPAGRTRRATNRDASGWSSAPCRQAIVVAARSPAASASACND